MATKKKGAGGKLSRSEIITVRLDPKLRFAAELAARKQRRTLSSFVEWAVETATKEVMVKDEGQIHPDDNFLWTAFNSAQSIFDVEEADRFCRFAFELPELMNFEEEKLWKLISESKYFWRLRKHGKEEQIIRGDGYLLKERVREQWENLNKIVNGEEATIPKEPLIIE